MQTLDHLVHVHPFDQIGDADLVPGAAAHELDVMDFSVGQIEKDLAGTNSRRVIRTLHGVVSSLKKG